MKAISGKSHGHPTVDVVVAEIKAGEKLVGEIVKHLSNIVPSGGKSKPGYKHALDVLVACLKSHVNGILNAVQNATHQITALHGDNVSQVSTITFTMHTLLKNIINSISISTDIGHLETCCECSETSKTR